MTASRLHHRAGATLAVALVLSAAAGIAAAEAARAEPAGSALRIVTPAPGSVIATGGLRAARSAVVPARVRVGRNLPRVSLRLNGRKVSSRAAAGRVLVARLSAAEGLRPGVNRLRVEAAKRRAKVPVNAVSQFTVTYPSARLIRLSPITTRGAVASRLRVPPSGVSSLSTALNGRSVESALSERFAKDRSRRLELSAAHGLRWGRNTLTVRVVMRNGRAEAVRRVFELDPRRNLAGLRLRGTAHVGRRVRLDAGSSQVVTGGLGRTTMRWSLRRRPLDSHSTISARGRRATFTPDVPGRYRIRVILGSGAAAGSATLSVTATYSSPLISLNSIDAGSPSALAVGPNRYPVTGGLQVNVLDRASLEWLSSRGFDATSSGISALGSYLKGLPNTNLVFVTHPSTSPVINQSDAAALNTALGYIGGSFPGLWQMNYFCWAGAADYCYNYGATDNGWVNRATATIGSFSIAGVRGMSAGEAWRATAAQSRSTEGRISGYLTRGVPAQTGGVDSYVIVAGADQFEQVDTCADGGPSQCVIRVGDQTFPPTPGVDGYNMVTLDRTTLTPINHVTATTVADMSKAMAPSTPGLQVGRQVPAYSADDQKIVVIQRVGSGILPAASESAYPNVDVFGGTPELLKAAIMSGTPYAMVGVADDPPWHGTATESSPLVSSGQTGRVRTVLSRNRNWLYTPSAGDPYGQTNLDLYSTIYQDPTPWPYVGDPAVAYIAGELSLPADVRSGYTNINVNFASKAALLSSLTCSDTQACGSNFEAVKKQLLNEFDWVEGTRSLITNLQYPFVVDQQSQPLNVEDVYNEISATVKPPPTKGTSFDFLGMFLEVTDLAGAVAFAVGEDDAGVALGLVSAGGEFASDSTSESNGDSSGTLHDEVEDLDYQLADQQVAFVEALDQLGAILVSDVGKLQTVGVSVGTDPAWNWSEGSTLSESITALNAASRAASYAALLPPTWGVFNLKGSGQSPPGSNDVTKYLCAGTYSGPVAIWAKAPAGNQLHAVYTSSTSEVWTFSNIYNIDNGGFWDYPYKNVTVPSSSLTDNLTSTNTLTGAFQYLPQWLRSTYNPPGAVDCTPIPGYASVAWTPPVLPNADAARTR